MSFALQTLSPMRIRVLRVLIVEDHKDTADTSAMLVRQWGYDAHVAYDSSAVELAAAIKPDVILLDISMPCIDGWAMAKRIKDQASAPIPVLVAITGWVRAEDRLRSAESGIDLHLAKPVEPEQLRCLLESLQETLSRPSDP
jgi:CheY-like chemotaxis protein